MPPDNPEALRRLVVFEIQRIIDDLELRQRFLIDMWARHRDRGPFLDSLFSRWRTLSMGELLLLDQEAMPHLEAFYRELEDLRLFFTFTDDMPTTLEGRYELGFKRLKYFAEAALAALGGQLELPSSPWDDEEDF